MSRVSGHRSSHDLADVHPRPDFCLIQKAYPEGLDATVGSSLSSLFWLAHSQCQSNLCRGHIDQSFDNSINRYVASHYCSRGICSVPCARDRCIVWTGWWIFSLTGPPCHSFDTQAIKPRKERNQAISIQLRTLFEEERSRNKSGASRPSSNRNGSGDVGMGSGGGRNGFGFERQMIEMGEFMKAGRIYNVSNVQESDLVATGPS